MRSIALLLTAAGLAVGAPQMGGMDMGGMDMGGMDMGGSSGGAASVPTTDGPVPQGVYLEKPVTQAHAAPNTKVVEMKYGPFPIGAMAMLDNKLAPNVALPCSNCFITAMQADLYDDSGKSINIDTGAWLHHMVMSLMGTGKRDLVCPIMMGTQRIFASGNERTPVRINGA